MTTVGDPLRVAPLDGRYQITQRLARGGMATVYRAVDMRLTRTVAVKVMHIGLGDEAEFARKFDREARAAAKLSHPNVVSVFDQGQDLEGLDSRPYIVMEYGGADAARRAQSGGAAATRQGAGAHGTGARRPCRCPRRRTGPPRREAENVLISDRGRIKVASDFAKVSPHRAPPPPKDC